MEKGKPHKRLMLRIQEMFYHYFSQDKPCNALYINGAAANAYTLISLLCAFNAKLQNKFTLFVYGYIKEKSHTSLPVRIAESRDEQMPVVSLLTKEGFINAYLHYSLDYSEVFLFSAISDAELRRFGYDIEATELDPFLRERTRINYLVPSNLHKAILFKYARILAANKPLVYKLDVLQSATVILEYLQLAHKTIIVGFSGGKDSTATYLVLRALYERYQYRLRAVCFDPLFNKFNLQQIQAVAAHFGIELEVIYKHVRVDLEDYSVCVACAKARRQALLGLRPDFLALGHHLQDAAETALMTGIHNAEFFYLRGSYLPRIDGTEDDIRIIRPLIFCTQDAVLTYLGYNSANVRFVSSDAAECEKASENERGSERGAVREFFGRVASYEWFL